MRPNTEKKAYARVLVPSYIPDWEWKTKSGDYSPWVITHETDEPNEQGEDPALTNDVLDDLYHEFERREEMTDPQNAGFAPDFSGFIQFLQEKGYAVLSVENGGVWRPM